MIQTDTHSNGTDIDMHTIGKSEAGKLAGEKLVKDTLIPIKIDWNKFITDHFWFGWYAEFDYHPYPVKKYWHRNFHFTWKPMVSRRP